MYPFTHSEVYRSAALTRFPLMDSHTEQRTRGKARREDQTQNHRTNRKGGV